MSTKEVAIKGKNEVASTDPYKVEASGGAGLFFPRIGLFSQDQTEGKGKSLRVTIEGGVFFLETQSEEVNEETGKKDFIKDEIGKEVEIKILYKRYQLRMYDGNTEEFTSSPIYDDENEKVQLYCKKQKTDEGTPKELIERYSTLDPKTGKKKSALELQRVLYVEYDGEIHQMNLRGSSMFALLKYEREVGNPTVYLTKIVSEFMEKGTNQWYKMTFSIKRKLTKAEETKKVKQQEELLAKIEEHKKVVSDDF